MTIVRQSMHNRASGVRARSRRGEGDRGAVRGLTSARSVCSRSITPPL